MPDIHISLKIQSAPYPSKIRHCPGKLEQNKIMLTELLPAQRVEPSLATVTLEIETSSSGIS